jgi:probable rRNA maturation factor
MLPTLWQAILPHITDNLPNAHQLASFSVILVSNPEIHTLNRQFRHKDEATDVLTFSMTEAHSYQPDLPEVQFGEIYLSLDWAQNMVQLKSDRVFKDHGNFEDPQVLFIVDRLVHGILHLLGVHHKSEPDYNRVIYIQNQVIYVLTQSPP